MRSNKWWSDGQNPDESYLSDLCNGTWRRTTGDVDPGETERRFILGEPPARPIEVLEAQPRALGVGAVVAVRTGQRLYRAAAGSADGIASPVSEVPVAVGPMV